MTSTPHGPDGGIDVPAAVEAYPLTPTDPARVGDFWLDARLTEGPAGVAYLGHDDPAVPVMLVMLAAGAAADPAARDRLAGEVNKMHLDTVIARGGEGQDSGRLGHRFRSEDDDPTEPDDRPLAPWVALAYDGSPAAVAEARRLLATVDLGVLGEGNSGGPAYALPWIGDDGPGVARLWPLPWPGRHDRAGWVSILASWLLMVLLAALAVLIAILIFQNAPPEQPPPPLPTTASPSQESPPPSPSESPSPSSSASPSESPASPSASPSGSGSPSPSGAGSPSPRSRL